MTIVLQIDVDGILGNGSRLSLHELVVHVRQNVQS